MNHFKTYSEVTDYLFAQLPMFQRIGAAAYKADLSKTYEICNLLGNPEKHFRSVHIAGTNGKGSTSNFLASILQEAGYKTGLFTSPHLIDFRERIRINGQKIPENEVLDFVNQYYEAFQKIQPSFFEWTWGLATQYFTKEKVNIAIVETGMGGRLDSTNVILPEISVITNIGWDHTQFLGDTLAKIAAEKAGIIKMQTPVVIGETTEEIRPVFVSTAQELRAPVLFSEEIYQVRDEGIIMENQQFRRQVRAIRQNGQSNNYVLGLCGKYQLKNLKTVLTVVDLLQQRGFRISEQNLRQGLENVGTNTGFRGRWEILLKNPLVVADIAHNINGLSEVLEQIARTPHQKLHFLLGVVNDKDLSGILKILPRTAVYYFCKPGVPRGLPVEELTGKAAAAGLKGTSFASPAEALLAAMGEADRNEDLILITGSAFLVADLIENDVFVKIKDNPASIKK